MMSEPSGSATSFTAAPAAGASGATSISMISSFSAALYETGRSTLSELLLDGVLVREGILDRAALENTLRDTTPVKGHDHLRILAIGDVEAWARGF